MFKTPLVAGLSSILIFSGSPALADGKDVLIGVGVGLLLNGMQQQHGGRRHPSDRLEGPVGRQRQGMRAPRPQRGERDLRQEAERRERQRQEQAEVSEIQSRLNTLHFNAGNPDGKAGNQTKTAVSAFQQSLGHPQTGVLTAEQKAMLIAMTSGAASTLAPQSVAAQPVQPATAAATTEDPFANATPLLPQPSNLDLANTITPGPNAGSPQFEVSIYGVRPGMGRDAALSAFKTKLGVENCQATETSITCKQVNATYKDEVVAGVTEASDGALIHSVIRKTEFSTPYPRASIDEKMRASYPALVASSDGIVTEGSSCRQAIQDVRAHQFAPLTDWIGSEQPATAQIARVASACPAYSELHVPAGDSITQLTIALFSGRILMPTLSEGEAGSAGPNTVAAPAEIRF